MKNDLFLLMEWTKIHLCMGAWPSIKEFKRLRSAYKGPGRHYHTFKHIADCIRFVNRHYGSGFDASLVKFALFFHDVVYDVKRKDNEELSALQWESYAKKSSIYRRIHGKYKLVADLIRMTAQHSVPEGSSLLYKMMSDADMHIFLCPDHHYLEYANNVWKEYSVFGREGYLTGRLAFLDTVDPQTMFYTHQAKRLVHHAVANLDLERTILKDRPDQLLT